MEGLLGGLLGIGLGVIILLIIFSIIWFQQERRFKREKAEQFNKHFHTRASYRANLVKDKE